MAECVEYLKKAEVLDYLIKCAEGAQADFDENGGESGIYVECLEDVIQDITSMAAADVEPVVRCKDCKKSGLTEFGKRYCSEPMGAFYGCIPVEDDSFCSGGVRKEPDANGKT